MAALESMSLVDCNRLEREISPMFLWRLLVATLIVAALIGLGWLDAGSCLPGLWFVPAAVAFTVTATDEAIALARQGGMNRRPGSFTGPIC